MNFWSLEKFNLIWKYIPAKLQIILLQNWRPYKIRRQNTLMYYYNNVIIKIVTECVQNLKFWTVDFWTQLVFDSSTWASSCATRNDNQLGKARRRCATRVASLNYCANALRAYSELCCLQRVLHPMLCMVCAGSSRVGSPGTCQVETWQKLLRASQPRTTTIVIDLWY